MKKKAAIVTLGCPKNQVDSEVLAGLLSSQYQLIEDPSQANVILVNTCTFIEEAKQESIDVLCEMLEYKKHGNCEKLFAVGCMAQRYGTELLTEIPELDGVLGDGELTTVEKNISQSDASNRVLTWNKNPGFIYDHEMPRKRSQPSYLGYIKIAEGCDNCCSYCVIPQIKGRYRSRPEDSIVLEAKKMAEEGVKEIILIAQDTTRYGSDLKTASLPSLLRKLVVIEEIKWIRLMYCYPDVFSDELINIIKNEPKICKYIDLPLQHADDQILSEMNRRYSADQAENLINKLREAVPEIVLRTTFITGFPGENQEQFNRLVAFVRKMKFDHLGVFAYSKEDNTVAGRRNDQIPVEVREQRKNIIMEEQARLLLEIQQKKIGRIVDVILEEEISPGYWIGRTEGDAPEIDGEVYIKLPSEAYFAGDILKARLTKADSYDFIGEVAE